ncbi:MAG: lamin tail domain-containing protein [Bacteroidota bacterium]|nr:lamin tail domain-containing protein [Bacteroidota bacterium]
MNKTLTLSLLLALAAMAGSFSQEIVINEFQASNATTIADPDFGAYPDWIELYNTSAQTIDLGSWYLTDNLEDTVQWQFPAGVTIDPGAYLLVWTDGRDVFQTDLHTNFKLSITGEEIALFDASRVLVDSITYGKQSEDISSGRQPDGDASWHFFDSPTLRTAYTNDKPLLLKMLRQRFSFVGIDRGIDCWCFLISNEIHLIWA